MRAAQFGERARPPARPPASKGAAVCKLLATLEPGASGLFLRRPDRSGGSARTPNCPAAVRQGEWARPERAGRTIAPLPTDTRPISADRARAARAARRATYRVRPNNWPRKPETSGRDNARSQWRSECTSGAQIEIERAPRPSALIRSAGHVLAADTGRRHALAALEGELNGGARVVRTTPSNCRPARTPYLAPPFVLHLGG